MVQFSGRGKEAFRKNPGFVGLRFGRSAFGLFILVAWVFAAMVFFAGCAEDPVDPNDYSLNTFYTGQGVPPRHPPRRASVEFFDKVCSDSGSSTYHGKSYECHYVDQ